MPHPLHCGVPIAHVHGLTVLERFVCLEVDVYSMYFTAHVQYLDPRTITKLAHIPYLFSVWKFDLKPPGDINKYKLSVSILLRR